MINPSLKQPEPGTQSEPGEGKVEFRLEKKFLQAPFKGWDQIPAICSVSGEF